MGGITCLLLLLWAGVTVSTVVDLQKRIIGGQICEPTARLYHVMLNDGNHNFLCGGSLISDRWILTAAHCWKGKMEAHLGVHPRDNKRSEVKTITRYEIFRDANGQHDIMLLELPSKTTTIKPVPLPDCDNVPRIGASVQIAGQGATTAGPKGEQLCGYSPTLQCADTTVVACSSKMNIHAFCGKKAGVDTCPGDSGGGVVYKDRIYGVHSCGGIKVCVTESEFIDVCQYMDWINNTTKSTLTKIGDKIKACFNCG